MLWFLTPWKKTSHTATGGKETITKLSFKIVWGGGCCLWVVGFCFLCLGLGGRLVGFCCWVLGFFFLVWLLSPFKIPQRSKQKTTLKSQHPVAIWETLSWRSSPSGVTATHRGVNSSRQPGPQGPQARLAPLHTQASHTCVSPPDYWVKGPPGTPKLNILESETSPLRVKPSSDGCTGKSCFPKVMRCKSFTTYFRIYTCTCFWLYFLKGHPFWIWPVVTTTV